ncbi:MAG TPA: hypothetical protein VK534_01840 [Methylomirabilota bacterium]|nr:hypothetical protein [Methylomirabilota bacterium]
MASRINRHDILSNRVDDGFTVYGHKAVEDILQDPLADMLVVDAIEAFNEASVEVNKRRRISKSEPFKSPDSTSFEIRIPSNEDVDEAVLWLGKSIVSRYHANFAVIDTRTAAKSNRATDIARGRLEKQFSMDEFGFIFHIEDQTISEAHKERIGRLGETTAKFGLPGINFLVVEAKDIFFDDPVTEIEEAELDEDAPWEEQVTQFNTANQVQSDTDYGDEDLPLIGQEDEDETKHLPLVSQDELDMAILSTVMQPQKDKLDAQQAAYNEGLLILPEVTRRPRKP